MMSRLFSFRSLGLVAVAVVGTAALFAGTAEAGGSCHSPRVVYVPAQTVYVRPAPVVRQVIVVQPARAYRPACR
jgi:hypothetical protein